MKPKWRLVLIVLGVALVLIIGVRIIARLKTSAKTETEQQSLVIRTAKVTKGEVLDQVAVSGTIRPANEVEIYPKIAGRIVTIHADLGQEVRAGEVLAVIEHQEIALAEKAALAALALARTNEAAAKVDVERARGLFEDNALSKAQLESAELKYAMTKAQSQSARADADIKSQQVKNASVTSLIAGSVTKRLVTLGGAVSPQAPIFAVQDISKLKLAATVDAKTLSRLAKGSLATLKLASLTSAIEGRVLTLAPSLDPATRRAAIEIELQDSSKQLVPNMFIEGALIFNKLTDVLIVPKGAILMREQKPHVFRIIGNKAELVSISTGAEDDYHTFILAGLQEGDVIATSGLERLQAGNLVTLDAAN